jgi:hypothetical protein
VICGFSFASDLT